MVEKATTTKRTTTTKKVGIAKPQENVTVTEPVKEVRKYDAHDLITCTSLTQGELIMVGKKSGVMYRWFQEGDQCQVEYQDLLVEIISRTSRYVYDPLFYIEDEELVAQHKAVQKVYDTEYSMKDLNEILSLPIATMVSVIEQLPKGIKESIKVLAATNIQTGALDSIKRIKALDGIFDTKLILEAEIFQ